MQSLKRTKRKKKKQYLLNISTLGGVLFVLISKKSEQKNNRKNVHVDHVQMEWLHQKGEIVAAFQVRHQKLNTMDIFRGKKQSYRLSVLPSIKIDFRANLVDT